MKIPGTGPGIFKQIRADGMNVPPLPEGEAKSFTPM